MPRGPKWSREEQDTLKRFYPHLSAERLSQAYQGRSPKALTSKAMKLEIRKTPERLQEMGREAVSKRWEKAEPRLPPAG